MKNTAAESPGRSQILTAYGRHLIAGVKVVKVPRERKETPVQEGSEGSGRLEARPPPPPAHAGKGDYPDTDAAGEQAIWLLLHNQRLQGRGSGKKRRS